jgi:hypothetical protein
MKEIYIEEYINHLENEINLISGTDEEMREKLLIFVSRIISDLKGMFLNGFN